MSNNINNACFPNLRKIGRILDHPRQKTKPQGTSIHAYHTTSKLHHIALHHSTLHYITSHCVELHSIHLQCSDNALQHVNTPYRALAPGRPTRGSFNRWGHQCRVTEMCTLWGECNNYNTIAPAPHLLVAQTMMRVCCRTATKQEYVVYHYCLWWLWALSRACGILGISWARPTQLFWRQYRCSWRLCAKAEARARNVEE